NSPSFSGRIVSLFDSMLIQQGEGSGTPTEPHHAPSQEAQLSSPTHVSTSYIPTVVPIPTVTQSEPTPLRHYTRRVKIAQSSALSLVADEPASPVRDVSKGEDCPTDSGFIADQDRATIAKSSTLPHDTAPWVTSPAAVEGNKEEGITRRVSSDTEEIRMDEREVAVERTSEDTEEMATVLTSMDAATVLAGGIDVSTGSYSIPTAGLRLQEQINAQVARELEEQQERKDKRMTEHIARDAEVARIHAEEEFQEKSTEEIPEEKVKEMMQLIPIEEVYVSIPPSQASYR
nr:hypothetical protein [Tanacetum cinerariifolium]